MSTSTPTVLIVEDEPDVRTLLRWVLESADQGIRVVAEAADGFQALDLFTSSDEPIAPDVVILDHRMPGRSGIELAREMRKHVPDQVIILYSTFFSPELSAEARRAGIDHYVSKLDYETLPSLVLQLAAEKAGGLAELGPMSERRCPEDPDTASDRRCSEWAVRDSNP